MGGFAWARPTATTAVEFAFVQVYSGNAKTDYLPFLWTMQAELIGSFLLLFVLSVFPRLRYPTAVVAAVALMLIVVAGSYTGCFLIGLLLGKMRAHGDYARLPGLFRRYGT